MTEMDEMTIDLETAVATAGETEIAETAAATEGAAVGTVSDLIHAPFHMNHTDFPGSRSREHRRKKHSSRSPSPSARFAIMSSQMSYDSPLVQRTAEAQEKDE